MIEEFQLTQEIDELIEQRRQVFQCDPLGLTHRNSALLNNPLTFDDIQLSLEIQTAIRATENSNSLAENSIYSTLSCKTQKPLCRERRSFPESGSTATESARTFSTSQSKIYEKNLKLLANLGLFTRFNLTVTF
jgi:hypothetical protein